MEIVEIDSDDGERDAQPLLKGALRGLNPNAVIQPTQLTVERADEDGNNGLKRAQPARHSTRQAYNGKSAANYDMKARF